MHELPASPGDTEQAAAPTPGPWTFSDYSLDPAERRLSRQGELVALTPRAFDLLVLLVERSGRLVRRDELRDSLWSDVIVEDGTIDRHVSALRKALDGDGRNLIETVPKAGYRFLGKVETAETESEELDTAASTAASSRSTNGDSLHATSRRWARLLVPLSLLLAAVLALVVGRRIAGPDASDTGTSYQSIAVLPFSIIGPVEDHEYLSLGLADVLISRLSQLPELQVRSLEAVRDLDPTLRDPLEAARRLGVEAVLEGTVHRQQGRLRVTARLLEADNGKALWSGSFDHSDRDLFAVERAISRQVASALAPALQDNRISEFWVPEQAIDTDAHDLYLRARFFGAKRTEEGLRRSVDLYEQALALEPRYAAAEAGLAGAWALLAGNAEAAEIYLTARHHAERALSLDPRSADAHAVLGLVLMNYDADWTGAEAEYQKALALDPNHITSLHWLGEMLALLGRFDEGIGLLEVARRLDPLSLPILSDLAKDHYFARRYDLAVSIGESVLELDPQFAWAYVWVGFAELARGRPVEGLARFERFHQLEPSTFASAYLILGLAANQRNEEAEDELLALENRATSEWVPALALAIARLAVGDDDGALDALERLIGSRQNRMGISIAPLFDELRPNPRFQVLLQEAGFDPVGTSAPEVR